MHHINLCPACASKNTSSCLSRCAFSGHQRTHHAIHHDMHLSHIQAHIRQHITLCRPYPCTCKHTSCNTSPCAPPPLTHQSTHHAAHRLVPPFLPRLNIQADIMQHSHVVPPLHIHAHIMQHIICSPSFTCPFNDTSCSTSSMPLFLLTHQSTHHAAHHDVPPSPHETHHLVPPFAYPTHIMQHLSLCPPYPSTCKHTSCSTSLCAPPPLTN